MNKFFIFFVSVFALSKFATAQPDFVLSGSVCAGTSVMVTLNSGTLTFTSNQWSSLSPGPIIASPGSSASQISFPNPGNFTILLSLVSGNITYYASHTITVHPLPVIALSASSTSLCAGQISTLTASGAVAYVWTPTTNLVMLSNSSAYVLPNNSVTYSATGTNSLGCSATQSIAMNVQHYPSLFLSASADSVCAGFTSTLTANGATNYTWTSVALANPVYQATLTSGPGTYSLTGANGVCLDSTVIVIKTAPALTLSIVSDRTMICIDGDDPAKPVNLNANGATNYSWEPYVPGRMTYSLGMFTSVSPTISTCYTLTGSSITCSASTVMCINVSTCTGLHMQKEDLFLVYPNPVLNELIIASQRELILSVTDIFGKLIYKEELKAEHTNHRISMEAFVPGIYFVKLQGSGMSPQTTRIIKM